MKKRLVVVRSLGEGNSQMLMKRYRGLVIRTRDLRARRLD